MSDLDLPPRLAALVAAERTAPTGDRAHVRAQLASSLGIALGAAALATTTNAAATTTAGATTAGALTSTIAGKLVVVALAIGAVGGGTALLVHERRSTTTTTALGATTRVAPAPATAADSASAPVPTSASASAPAPASVRTTAAVGSPAAAARGAASLPISRSTPAVRAVDDDQHVLLARAWSALSRNDASEVLALVDRDALLHATGALAEEREALRVEALRRLERTTDADHAARAFLARFPDSIHRALVAHALTKETP